MLARGLSSIILRCRICKAAPTTSPHSLGSGLFPQIQQRKLRLWRITIISISISNCLNCSLHFPVRYSIGACRAWPLNSICRRYMAILLNIVSQK